jgi:hypothetical protein
MIRDRWCAWRVLGLMLLALSGVDCQADASGSSPASPEHRTASAASQPAAAADQKEQKTQTFENKKAGIRFKYPAGWTSVQGQTSTFAVEAPAGSIKGTASLTLDVPHLPPHLPGMISPKMVADGYVDDLKKNQIHDAKVDEAVDVRVAGAPGRRVKCSGHAGGKVAIDVAVAVVHSDRVYIFSCDSDADGYDTARASLDAAVASVEWIK